MLYFHFNSPLDYAVRWCRKREETDPELNNAITEQVSHCRKKLRKVATSCDVH